MLLNELTEGYDPERGKYNSEFMYQLTQQSRNQISGFKYITDNKDVVDDAYANNVPVNELVQKIVDDYFKDDDDDDEVESEDDFHDPWGPEGRYGNYGDEERDDHYDWEAMDDRE